jgi:molybdopterin synthase catalytic subunit/molybdopterin converting factor small subunit
VATVDVRLFAGLRERAGTGRCALEVDEGAPVGRVWDLLGLGERPPGIAYAVNRAYVEPDHPLADGDEVALIPPVSGGAEAPRIGVQLTDGPLDIAGLHARANDPRAGAQAAFTGTVRNRTGDKEVLRLEYEAYAEMAVEELERIAHRAAADHGLVAVEIAHRTGVVLPGEASVVIVSTARHRPSALAATQWIIEQLKASVPIWKREVYADGSTWVGQGS